MPLEAFTQTRLSEHTVLIVCEHPHHSKMIADFTDTRTCLIRA
jgi:hypothetical protein